MKSTLSNKPGGREGNALLVSAMVSGIRRRRAPHSPLNQPGWLGEPPSGVDIAACQNPWLVLLGKELSDQFSAAAHADFLEDRLKVVLHRMGGNVEGVCYLCRR